MKKKTITNEDLMKQLEELKKKIDAQPVPVPVVIPQLPVVVCPGHTHCTCQWCHPQPYYPLQPYYTTIGLQSGTIGGNLMSTNGQ